MSSHQHQQEAGEKPLWEGNGLQRGEPVLFRLQDGRSTGRLLYPAERILRMSLADGTELTGDCVEVLGNVLVSRSSQFPVFQDSDLFPSASEEGHDWWSADGRHIRYDCRGLYRASQVLVDYETRGRWNGPIPTRQDLSFAKRLSKGERLKIVLLGDSISAGADASAFLDVPPHQPAYGELFVHRLRRAGYSLVEFENLSKGGMTAKWGCSQMDRLIETAPDLTLIAFGMNDASEKHEDDVFRRHMEQMVEELQSRTTTEVLLLSGMTANTAWDLAESPRRDRFHQILTAMGRPGVGFCDVHSIWKHVEDSKGFWSLTGNGLNHPNDFGHRLYADCVAAAVGTTSI